MIRFAAIVVASAGVAFSILDGDLAIGLGFFACIVMFAWSDLW